MNLNEYQKQALTTDSFGGKNVPVTDPAFVAKILGLVGEAGEVAEKFKKIIRNKSGKMDETDRQEVIKELGDLLWYISVMSHYLGADLDEVAKNNLAKLADRHSRGVIKSSGDNR
jgi:NTP pyrophosphatase (non-canonical NTP hydrolase)